MKKLLYGTGIRAAAILAAFLLLAGCAGSNTPPSPTQSVPDPAGLPSETERSAASETASNTDPAHDSGAAQMPAEPDIVFYHGDVQVSPDVQAELKGAGVEITDSRFTYYVDPDGFPTYFLIVECRNTGTAALFSPSFTVRLNDADHRQVEDFVIMETVCGIMPSGAADYAYSFPSGHLAVRDDKGSYEPMEIDLSRGLFPVIEAADLRSCTQEFTFVTCETDIRMETTPSGRISFSGRVTNPSDVEFGMLVQLRLKYLLFDADHRILAILPQGVPNLPAKQTAEVFPATLPNLEITPDQVAEFVTYAETWYG